MISRISFPNDYSREEFLRKISKEGLLKRIKDIQGSADSYELEEHTYIKRLDYELDMICKLDFAGYFLIVADLPIRKGFGSLTVQQP